MAYPETQGVVVSSVRVPDDMNYAVVVRLDRSGELVTVRFPDAKKKGTAVRVKV